MGSEAIRQGKRRRDTFLVGQQVALPRKQKLCDPLRACTRPVRIFAEVLRTRRGCYRDLDHEGTDSPWERGTGGATLPHSRSMNRISSSFRLRDCLTVQNFW